MSSNMRFDLNNGMDLENLKDNIEYAKSEFELAKETMKNPDSYSPHSDMRVMSFGNEDSKVGKVVAIIFVVYFLVSMVLLVATSKNDENICLIVFGQLFVVFGFFTFLAAIKNIKNKKYRITQRITTLLLSLLVILVGASVGGVGILKKTGNYDSFIENLKYTISGGNPDFNLGKLAAASFISIFIIVGILIMIKTPIRLSRLRKVATVTAHAKLIDYVRPDKPGRRRVAVVAYYPIWEYTYGGETYRIASVFPMDYFDKSMIGTKEGIVYLDPENPAESISAADYNGPNIHKGEFAIGAFFAGLATVMLLCILAAM